MGPPPFFFFFPMLFMLLFWAVPIYFVVRWASRVRRALEANNPPQDLPGREYFDRLSDRLDSVADDVQKLQERQDFVERLLQAPRVQAVPPPTPAAPPPAGAGEPPAP